MRQSLQETQNKIVNINDLSQSLARKLQKAVSNYTTENIIAAMEAALSEELSVNQNIMDKAQLLSDFMSINGHSSVQSFCSERDINIKTFERMSLYVTGYTPKILRSIMRFQTSGNQLIHQPMERLTEIAYNHCFADQSHFIKDFTRFSGTAPRAFLSEKASVKENVSYTYR